MPSYLASKTVSVDGFVLIDDSPPLLIDGTVINTPITSTTGANSSVAGTTSSSTTLLAANAARRGATVFNDNDPVTGAILFVSLGATCTSSNYTVRITQNGYFEIPFNYTGIVTGVFSTAVGNARITELT